MMDTSCFAWRRYRQEGRTAFLRVSFSHGEMSPDLDHTHGQDADEGGTKREKQGKGSYLLG